MPPVLFTERSKVILPIWVFVGLTFQETAPLVRAPPPKPITGYHAEHMRMDSLVRELARKADVPVEFSRDALRAMAREHVTAHIPFADSDDALESVLSVSERANLRFVRLVSSYRVELAERYPVMTACPPAFRRSPAITQQPVTIELNNSAGLIAVKKVIGDTGAGYVVNSAVGGTVSLKLDGVSLDRASELLADRWQNVRGLAIYGYRIGEVYTFRRTADLGRRNSNVSLRVANASVVQAVASILDAAGANYVLNTELGGDKRVTVALRNVPLDDGLRQLWTAGSGKSSVEIDPGGDVYSLYEYESRYRELPRRSLESVHYTLRLRDADVRWVIKRIMTHINANYTLDPSVRGPVSLSMRNASGDKVLAALLKRCSPPVSYIVEDKVYNFVAK